MKPKVFAFEISRIKKNDFFVLIFDFISLDVKEWALKRCQVKKNKYSLELFCEIGKFKIDNPFLITIVNQQKKTENHFPIMRVMCPTPLNGKRSLDRISLDRNCHFSLDRKF